MGEVQDPPEEEWHNIRIRRFGENTFPQDERRKIWQRHREHDKNSRKRNTFADRDELARWQETGPCKRLRMERLYPMEPGSAEAESATAKAAPRQPSRWDYGSSPEYQSDESSSDDAANAEDAMQAQLREEATVQFVCESLLAVRTGDA